jgi:NOL1/NOP2/fmu family ribosome biogenesis protein
MQRLHFLSRKDAKEILSYMEKQWGADLKRWLDEYIFLLSGKDKLYIVSKSVGSFNLDLLRISSAGIYIAEIIATEPRLSIEGAQLIGPLASKNVIELPKEKAAKWLRGENVEFESDAKGFVIIKHENDFMGTGKCKEGLILNYVPKARRLPSA